jgi:hypothetical protein
MSALASPVNCLHLTNHMPLAASSLQRLRRLSWEQASWQIARIQRAGRLAFRVTTGPALAGARKTVDRGGLRSARVALKGFTWLVREAVVAAPA